jgi:competence protein ComEA
VVTIAAGSIIQEAIEAAGGATHDADPSRLNLAQQLRDGQQVFVPAIAQAPSNEQPAPLDLVNSNKLNINTATEVQLEQLPGIGPSLAANIVEYRQQHGWFQDAEELLKVSGIGPAKLEQIADLITLN